MQKVIFATAILVLGLQAVAQQTVTCSSRNGGTRFCPADTSNGVMLVQEHSNGVCRQGSTWTYTNRGISVNGGCSADFQVGGSPGNDQSGGYGNSSNRNRRNADEYPNNDSQNSYPDARNNDTNSRDGYGGYGDRQRTGMSIPAGTRIDVRLEQTVTATEVNEGELIPVTLANDLSVNDRVLAPAGTAVQAKVVSARGAPLDIRLDSMTVRGQTYRLTSSSIHSAKDAQTGQDSDSGSPAQGIGAVVGALTGGQQLRRGSVYTFRLTSPARPIRTDR